MSFDYALCSVAGLVVLGYLIVALLAPERF